MSQFTIYNFPLSWRFVKEGFDPLPKSILELIIPIDEDLSYELWGDLAAPHGEHLMESLNTILSNDASHTLLTADLWWYDDDETHKLTALLERYGFNNKWSSSTPIIVFWHARTSVLTKWHVFLQYSDNFFYPSDESGVVASLDAAVNLYFLNSCVYLVDRKRALQRK